MSKGDASRILACVGKDDIDKDKIPFMGLPRKDYISLWLRFDAQRALRERRRADDADNNIYKQIRNDAIHFYRDRAERLPNAKPLAHSMAPRALAGLQAADPQTDICTSPDHMRVSLQTRHRQCVDLCGCGEEAARLGASVAPMSINDLTYEMGESQEPGHDAAPESIGGQAPAPEAGRELDGADAAEPEEEPQ